MTEPPLARIRALVDDVAGRVAALSNEVYRPVVAEPVALAEAAERASSDLLMLGDWLRALDAEP